MISATLVVLGFVVLVATPVAFYRSMPH